jgi:transposase
MQTYLRPSPHLSYEEVTKRYRSCPDARLKTWWHIIWLMSDPDQRVTVTQAASLVGCHPNWARQIVHRYNGEGPEGLTDKRASNPGQEPLLNEEQRAELSQALLGRAPDGGLWTGPKVGLWVKDKIGRTPGHTAGWKYLRRLGFTLQQPRPSNTSAASRAEQATFKKSFRAVLEP